MRRAHTCDNPSARATRQRSRGPPPRAPAGGRNSSLPAARRSSAGWRRHTPPSARTRPAPPPRAPAGGSPSARLSHLLHERPERRPALLVVLEHVVARARRRQQDGVARSRRAAGAKHHILEGRPTLEWHLAAEIPLDQLARLAVRDHQTPPAFEERR